MLSALAHNVEAIADECKDFKHLMVTKIADLYQSPKKQIISFGARYLKGIKITFKDELPK
ncbi:hypothetical protein ACH24_00730 [Francisella persica ATCC VR-331]|uniref:Uncharacterized protein n=1 Tax=Francisella persica ATCC VR-331 TaxID=1086726 RepID=A0AAC8VCR2_9GAMM|nr:hypothetical protein ACH24_00730 [Francisella persica ATCC VR-331]ANH77634.1 hypothetical protein FSC845_03555 [Francisella persica ATCC VR-331]